MPASGMNATAATLIMFVMILCELPLTPAPTSAESVLAPPEEAEEGTVAETTEVDESCRAWTTMPSLVLCATALLFAAALSGSFTALDATTPPDAPPPPGTLAPLAPSGVGVPGFANVSAASAAARRV